MTRTIWQIGLSPNCFNDSQESDDDLANVVGKALHEPIGKTVIIIKCSWKNSTRSLSYLPFRKLALLLMQVVLAFSSPMAKS